MSVTDQAPKRGPLELLPILSREDAEDGLKIGCPFCTKVVSLTEAQAAAIWRHRCESDDGPVYFLNGHALRGAARYNRANVPKGRS
jgi:hypothetical protein